MLSGDIPGVVCTFVGMLSRKVKYCITVTMGDVCVVVLG